MFIKLFYFYFIITLTLIGAERVKRCSIKKFCESLEKVHQDSSDEDVSASLSKILDEKINNGSTDKVIDENILEEKAKRALESFLKEATPSRRIKKEKSKTKEPKFRMIETETKHVNSEEVGDFGSPEQTTTEEIPSTTEGVQTETPIVETTPPLESSDTVQNTESPEDLDDKKKNSEEVKGRIEDLDEKETEKPKKKFSKLESLILTLLKALFEVSSKIEAKLEGSLNISEATPEDLEHSKAAENKPVGVDVEANKGPEEPLETSEGISQRFLESDNPKIKLSKKEGQVLPIPQNYYKTNIFVWNKILPGQPPKLTSYSGSSAKLDLEDQLKNRSRFKAAPMEGSSEDPGAQNRFLEAVFPSIKEKKRRGRKKFRVPKEGNEDISTIQGDEHPKIFGKNRSKNKFKTKPGKENSSEIGEEKDNEDLIAVRSSFFEDFEPDSEVGAKEERKEEKEEGSKRSNISKKKKKKSKKPKKSKKSKKSKKARQEDIQTVDLVIEKDGVPLSNRIGPSNPQDSNPKVVRPYLANEEKEAKPIKVSKVVDLEVSKDPVDQPNKSKEHLDSYEDLIIEDEVSSSKDSSGDEVEVSQELNDQDKKKPKPKTIRKKKPDKTPKGKVSESEEDPSEEDGNKKPNKPKSKQKRPESASVEYRKGKLADSKEDLSKEEVDDNKRKGSKEDLSEEDDDNKKSKKPEPKLKHKKPKTESEDQVKKIPKPRSKKLPIPKDLLEPRPNKPKVPKPKTPAGSKKGLPKKPGKSKSVPVESRKSAKPSSENKEDLPKDDKKKPNKPNKSKPKPKKPKEKVPKPDNINIEYRQTKTSSEEHDEENKKPKPKPNKSRKIQKKPKPEHQSSNKPLTKSTNEEPEDDKKPNRPKKKSKQDKPKFKEVPIEFRLLPSESKSDEDLSKDSKMKPKFNGKPNKALTNFDTEEILKVLREALLARPYQNITEDIASQEEENEEEVPEKITKDKTPKISSRKFQDEQESLQNLSSEEIEDPEETTPEKVQKKKENEEEEENLSGDRDDNNLDEIKGRTFEDPSTDQEEEYKDSMELGDEDSENVWRPTKPKSGREYSEDLRNRLKGRKYNSRTKNLSSGEDNRFREKNYYNQASKKVQLVAPIEETEEKRKRPIIFSRNRSSNPKKNEESSGTTNKPGIWFSTPPLKPKGNMISNRMLKSKISKNPEDFGDKRSLPKRKMHQTDEDTLKKLREKIMEIYKRKFGHHPLISPEGDEILHKKSSGTPEESFNDPEESLEEEESGETINNRLGSFDGLIRPKLYPKPNLHLFPSRWYNRPFWVHRYP